MNKLRNFVKSCLYRHIITPHRDLSADRPFALAAWGASIEFSVVHMPTLTEFVRKFALTAPEKTSRDGQYKILLEEPAKIVSDQDDSKLCPSYN